MSNMRLKKRTFGRSKKNKVEGLGYKLRKSRIDAGLSQVEAAAQIGVPQSAVSFYENGKCEPSLKIISELANMYGVNVDYLISKEE